MSFYFMKYINFGVVYTLDLLYLFSCRRIYVLSVKEIRGKKDEKH